MPADPILPLNAVRQVSLPARTRQTSTLARIDYSDAFLVDAGIELDPERWARAMIEEAPRAMRLRLVLGWTSLGLRLGSPWAANRILGWKVAQRTPGFVLLTANSWLGLKAQLVFHRRRGGVVFATVIQQENRAARSVWGLITPTHQAVVASLLLRVVHRELGIPAGASRSADRSA